MKKVLLKDFIGVVLAMNKARKELQLPEKNVEVIDLNFVREIIAKKKKKL